MHSGNVVAGPRDLTAQFGEIDRLMTSLLSLRFRSRGRNDACAGALRGRGAIGIVASSSAERDSDVGAAVWFADGWLHWWECERPCGRAD